MIKYFSRNILASFGGVGLVFILGFAQQGIAAPSAEWSTNIIDETLSPGEVKTIEISFTASKNFNNAQLQVTPSLADYIEVSPSNIGNVAAGEIIQFEVTLTSSTTALIDVIDGVIQIVRANARRISSPLPVVIEFTTEIEPISGVSLVAPEGWDVFTDHNQVAGELSLLLNSQASLNELINPDLVHVTHDIVVAVLPNPDQTSISDFAAFFDNGWFAHYPNSNSYSVLGYNALQVDDLGSDVGRAPAVVNFIELPDDRILIVMLPRYESELISGAIEIMNELISSLEID